jgi:hypothetical protein
MEDGMNGISALAIGAVFLPLSAGVAPMAIPVQSAAPSAVQPTAPEKRVCRTMTDLGSIIPRHICATRKQWDEVVRANEADRDALNEGQHAKAPSGALQQRQ